MKLETISQGSEVFIDSNIFIYHFTNSSEECSKFLERCEYREISGFTSVNVLLEVLHRLMMIEVVKKGLLSTPNLVKKINKNPEIIKQLNDYFINTQKIKDMEISIFSMDFTSILSSHSYRFKYGLMVNDSLITATMEREKILNLASNDRTFLAVKNINVFQPSDIDF
ncbi:MAG: PIN domain-containing protein [Spirochaetes bacterium]|nr:PIN domain-containing protein [Spirochaetota bacterium]MCK5033483.1 PIN domain-containing protein [Calditrichia bacterium]